MESAIHLVRPLYYRLPEDLRNAILVRARAGPLWSRAGIVFIHIPRVAGTSMSYALYGRFIVHARACDLERWGSPKLKALPSFAITRNPWDRLVSAYRFARRGRGVGGVQQAWVWKPQQYRLAEFDSFDSFVKDWLCFKDVSELDGIFQPQSAFVCDHRGKLLVDHVGRLEDLGPTYDFIRQHLGSAPQLEKSNRSGAAIDYRTFYTPELAEIVGEIYAEDVSRFHYRFDR